MTTMAKKAAKPLLGERLERISLSFAREQVRTLTNKATGLAGGERRRVAEIYGAMHRGNPVALEEAYRFYGTSVFVRDKVRQVRAGVIASSPGMVCTSAEPQQHAKVGDLWNPRRDDEDDYSFAVRLKAPGGGAFVLSEAEEWIPLTDETQHLVGKWGRDEAAEADVRLEVAEAKVTLARWLWGVALARFARRLAATPFLDDNGDYASATHALFALTEALDRGEAAETLDSKRLGRVLVLAQAEWSRLGRESELVKAHRAEPAVAAPAAETEAATSPVGAPSAEPVPSEAARTDSAESKKPTCTMVLTGVDRVTLTEGETTVMLRGTRRRWLVSKVFEARRPLSWAELVAADLERASQVIDRRRRARSSSGWDNVQPRMTTQERSMQNLGSRIREKLGKLAYHWDQNGHGVFWSHDCQ